MRTRKPRIREGDGKVLERKRVRSRADVLITRATGLSKFGKTLVKDGKHVPTEANWTTKGGDKHPGARDS